MILKDKERIQPHAGRLDLLLQDPDSSRRFEVEIQLGKTDRSYWEKRESKATVELADEMP